MNVRVYRRHAGGPASLMVFLFVWSSGWMFGAGSSLVTGRTLVKGREVDTSSSNGFLFTMLLVGATVFSVALGLWLRRRNDRIELAGTTLSWFDWRGRPIGQADLSEVKDARDAEDYADGWGRRFKFKTAQGEFFFGKAGTEGFFDLRERLRSAVHGTFYGADEVLPPPRDGAEALESHIYRYRFSGFHMISIFPLFAGGVSFHSALIYGHTAPALFIGTILIGFGLWVQLIGWYERIEVHHNLLRWFDCLGRLKAEIPTSELLGVCGTPNSGGLYRIEGIRSTIRFSLYLWRAQSLTDQIEGLLQRP